MTERSKEELIEILDNIIYWDSCPELYKEKIPNLITEIKALTIPVVMQRFIDVIQNDKKVFIGHLDEENYIEIQYVGWNSKGVKSYKIQVWRDECGCIYEEIKRFPNMEEAILCAVSNAA